MRYTVIVNGEREIINNVDYIFMDEHRIQLLNDRGMLLKAYDKNEVKILTKFS